MKTCRYFNLAALAAVLAGTGGAFAAPALIGADDYSGFMRGDGYAYPMHSAPEVGVLSITRDLDEGVLEWASGAILTIPETSGDLTGDWDDLLEAFSPHRVPLPTVSISPGGVKDFFRLRPRGQIHSGVGTGCPQQGFETTILPGTEQAIKHWTNILATPTTCGWIVPEEQTGFADESDMTQSFVRVVMRSFYLNPGLTWWQGPTSTWEDDAIHQNDGWFHFRVRQPGGGIGLGGHLMRFEIAWDNPYAFPDPPLQVNAWWYTGYVWDWEDRAGRHVYTPIYRIKQGGGTVGPWQHFADAETSPVTTHQLDGRSYRCRFEKLLPDPNAWAEVEVAQNLPYSLSDRKRFLRHLLDTYPGPDHPDLCIRKKHLGWGGLAGDEVPLQPGEDPEKHELYAIEIYRKVPGTDSTPDLPNDKILVVLAGIDYEPAGNWVAEGTALEILDQWDTGIQFRNFGSYVIIPIGNPDGYEWPSTHCNPFGNGYGDDNAIHRGYIFLEAESVIDDPDLDDSSVELREYMRSLDTAGLDGSGGTIVALLDYQNDLCPHSDRWAVDGSYPPPIFGFFHHVNEAQLTRGREFVSDLRIHQTRLYTSHYVRDPDMPGAWTSDGARLSNYGIPLVVTFEFDAAALFSRHGFPRDWVDGEFGTSIELPGIGTDPEHFYVHGYIDEIGYASSPGLDDPAWVFKQFGRDIAKSARFKLLVP